MQETNPGLHHTTTETDVGCLAMVAMGAESIAPQRPSELGGLAVGVTLEPVQSPEVDVEAAEHERKKNTEENLRALQKRFGERFVKGELMEGGGYTGGAARELLARFMDRPGFANELKRLIPGKHRALQLLKDNQEYIQATLEQRYNDDSSHEKQPPKDPYELARSVGYELTGPFESTAEFVSYAKRDFRPRERLCTFNNPTKRLGKYKILWLRHTEVDTTLPADQLTTDNLNETWKTYLKTIGRYDQDSDSYDLSGLRATRDDPYGTSSMSVQISRKGTHVSIKNRYNHTVGNPDNTLDSNLDNVAHGLRHTVYARVGREDLMDKTAAALAEGYIADNEGGIHHYHYEEDNVYYGHYEYIENGVITTIDPSKYYMISPQIYVPKSGKGNELYFGQRATGPEGLEVSSDVHYLHSYRPTGNEKDSTVAELWREYAEHDLVELKARTVEYIREQAQSAHDASIQVSEQLGIEQISQQRFTELLNAKHIEWQQSGVYDYLVDKLITDGARPSLVATPNIEATEAQIVALAEDFGKDQPEHTYVYDYLYRKKHYTNQQWSGNTGTDEPIRLSLVPSSFDSEMGYNSADTQLEHLQTRQANQPNLNIRIPSLLEAVTYWYTLRAQGDKLDDSSTYDKTHIRHIDLRPIEVDGHQIFPLSCMVGDGKPYLGDSYAGVEAYVRTAVG